MQTNNLYTAGMPMLDIAILMAEEDVRLTRTKQHICSTDKSNQISIISVIVGIIGIIVTVIGSIIGIIPLLK